MQGRDRLGRSRRADLLLELPLSVFELPQLGHHAAAMALFDQLEHVPDLSSELGMLGFQPSAAMLAIAVCRIDLATKARANSSTSSGARSRSLSPMKTRSTIRSRCTVRVLEHVPRSR